MQLKKYLLKKYVLKKYFWKFIVGPRQSERRSPQPSQLVYLAVVPIQYTHRQLDTCSDLLDG